MDPIIAVYSIRVTVRKTEDAPEVEAPTSSAVEDACASAVGNLVIPGGYTAEGAVTVHADAVRTDS